MIITLLLLSKCACSRGSFNTFTEVLGFYASSRVVLVVAVEVGPPYWRGRA